MFARKKGKALTITTTQETRPNDAESTLTVYHINGLLFFGSVESLKEKLDPEIDASDVILDLTDAKVMDLSAIQCINLIGQKYTDQNKQLLVRNPGTQCRLLMNSAKDITSITLAE